MQLMSWTLGRLGSRFSLLFEPGRHRLMHSALGRFFDKPVDLMIGLVEPDGTERVLPLTTRGRSLFNPEQFERNNSITFRGYSERYRLLFEFNVHAVFYPQHERLCILPAYYLELRVNPSGPVRGVKPAGETPAKVKLFIRLARPETQIRASAGTAGDAPGVGGARIDLTYRCPLTPRTQEVAASVSAGPEVEIHERIVSLNPGVSIESDGMGLTCELPVTEPGSGIKWRLVWGAHCGEPVLQIGPAGTVRPARLRYNRYWKDIDAVMATAVGERDDWLAHSRRFEKVFDQTPPMVAQSHLTHQGFQHFLANTFWCDIDGAASPNNESGGAETDGSQWFSVWGGSGLRHGRLDVEYHNSLFYLTLWPDFLPIQFNQWAALGAAHGPSSGTILLRDVGRGVVVGRPGADFPIPVEGNSDFLLMLQAYVHWTGDLTPAQRHADLIERLAAYLLWSDTDSSGFPTEGSVSSIDDAGPALWYGRKQTYLAVKRLAALRAAADLLGRLERKTIADRCLRAEETDGPRIEAQAWLGDHYAICADHSAVGLRNPRTSQPLSSEEVPGWDAYSICGGDGLLLPLVVGQACLMDRHRMKADLLNAARESLSRYGCGSSSSQIEGIFLSQNIWRDHLGRYLGAPLLPLAQFYWDLQVMSNTVDLDLGYVDGYVSNDLTFSPRGAACLGFFLAGPRLRLDRLTGAAPEISVEPDTHYPQRWPLLPLADWQAGKIPICVVDPQGRITIEGQIDPITIRHLHPEVPQHEGLIG